uniref:LIM zinc-binding domain-containing protein n=1 Tax=Steinernema glaseri TaxID=37863 RepID=A0A1I8ANP0_9BILA
MFYSFDRYEKRMTTTYQYRSESRTSKTSEHQSEHANAVNDTLQALEQDVQRTTEILRRKHEQQILERRTFTTEMEVNGRISVEPQEDWLSTRIKSISTEDMKKELGKVKDDQRRNAVEDTLAALVYDVNATAEVLRRGSLKKKKKPAVVHEEVEYKLRLTPQRDEYVPPRRSEPPADEPVTMDQVSKDYGVEISESQMSSLKRRARSTTPKVTLNVEQSPPPTALPICAYCNEEVEGPVITALAPNSVRAQKFHPYHFMCTYCLKALNLRGTYREHERKPYCHECFYKLYNGLQYSPDDNQASIEKLI